MEKLSDFKRNHEEENDPFDPPIPSQIKRHMSKFIDSLQKEI